MMKITCLLVLMAVAAVSANTCVNSYDEKLGAVRRLQAMGQVKETCGEYAKGSPCFEACREYVMAKAIPLCDSEGNAMEPCRDLCLNFHGLCELDTPCEETVYQHEEACSTGPSTKRPSKDDLSVSFSSFSGLISLCETFSLSSGDPVRKHPELWPPCALVGCNMVVASSGGISALETGNHWATNPHAAKKHRSYQACTTYEGEHFCTAMNQTSYFGCFKMETSARFGPAVSCPSEFGNAPVGCIMEQRWAPQCHNRQCCALVNNQARQVMLPSAESSITNYVMEFRSNQGDRIPCVSMSSGYDRCEQRFQVFNYESASACAGLEYLYLRMNNGVRGDPFRVQRMKKDRNADDLSFDLF